MASAVIKQTDVDNTSKQSHSVLSEPMTPSSKCGMEHFVNRSDAQEEMQCASTGQSSFGGTSSSYKWTTDGKGFCKEARSLSLKSYS